MTIKKFIALVILAAISFVGVAADKDSSLPKKVKSQISSFIKSIRGSGCCYESAKGDLNGDGAKDLVVLFTVEGACYNETESSPGACGNGYSQYLMAFLGKDLKSLAPVEAGGKTARSIAAMQIKGGKLFLNTLEYGDDDPSCCPSIKKEVTVKFTDGNLKEVEQ
jgi:hypothetical protein